MTLPMIPISVIQLGEEEEKLVIEVLRSGRLAQGPMVDRLEAGFRNLTGAAHAVAVSSGTTALVAAIEVLDLEPGAEVLTSPFTFVATVNAILEAGAVARFVDISSDFTMDPTRLADAVGPRTRVVMPVHLYGQPADMETISAIAEHHGLAVVEDAAQAHGARVGARRVGTWGQACFSLYATKNITTGEGGIITTDDEALADRLRLLRNQGMRARYRYEFPGHNYRMTDLQAAVGIPQLDRLEQITATRRANAAMLRAGLEDLEGLQLPSETPGRTHVWHQFTVRITPEAPLDRDTAIGALAELGVNAGVFYPKAVYDYDCYRSHPNVVVEPMPRAEAAAKEVLSLPVHPALTNADLDRIVTAVRKVLRA